MNTVRSYTAEALDAHLEAGKKRSKSERALLSIMFNGFSVLDIEANSYNYVCMLEKHCSLDEYTSLIRAYMDQGYSDLSDECKKYFHVILVIDSLVENGLVERRVYFSDDFTPEDGFVDLNGKLDGTDAQCRSWLAQALVVSDINSKSFCYPEYMRKADERSIVYTLEKIQYHLTTKGYDVALKFEEHDDQQLRFSQQTQLAQKATEASESSAKTASRAIWAASFIAVGSLGNLVFIILRNYSII